MYGKVTNLRDVPVNPLRIGKVVMPLPLPEEWRVWTRSRGKYSIVDQLLPNLRYLLAMPLHRSSIDSFRIVKVFIPEFDLENRASSLLLTEGEDTYNDYPPFLASANNFEYWKNPIGHQPYLLTTLDTLHPSPLSSDVAHRECKVASWIQEKPSALLT